MKHLIRFSAMVLFLPGFTGLMIYAQNGQIAIPRIENMPFHPSPFNILDWHRVAQLYDSFVYDVNKKGTYLPLVTIGNFGINYPDNKTIQMHTYVGTASPLGSEAINVLPSLVGASLVGINKSNQFGQNWLAMSQDFFNQSNGENIYLNNAGSGSGSDWWYDLMPNLFFYQLYDLYPGANQETKKQFSSIAERLSGSVRAMGAGDRPWTIPNMNYRGWKFKLMQPNASGVKEPEAAGAYAWILYHAWKQTGNAEYLKCAEWAMEFLDQYPDNPSYELQLPYGTYVAAKMNAELGTTYDIAKMVNWSFNRGALRGWGTILGNWGGFDVSGLVGEANDKGDDYAFQLNGIQQAAALIPMVRYDKRFSAAIGKWMLNLANATRLFYPGYLPARLQDASTWSAANDPNQVIGYEALREKWQGSSPFSTGDALKGGWAATNLALYGCSSIGYLGGCIEKTNVEKIIKLDLLKTDFFRAKAYPTFLMYNPYDVAKTVDFTIGALTSDLYESLSEKFIQKNVNGIIPIIIPAHQAVQVSILPAGGLQTFDRNRMLINDVIVDYQQSLQAFTRPVRIKALASDKQIIQFGDSAVIYATSIDPDNAEIKYNWNVSNGFISGHDSKVVFHPNAVGVSSVRAIVMDLEGNMDTAFLNITVVKIINAAPRIQELRKASTHTETNDKVLLTCFATDSNQDSLMYEWTSDQGFFTNSTSRQVTWTAPATEGIVTISVKVTDPGNLSTQASTTILVKRFSTIPAHLIAYYPFSGSTEDVSGNQLNGQGNGTVFVPDKNGSVDKACYFNGGAQHVRVNNSPLLNVQNALSVSCWFNAARFPDKETFLLSHGSWQNRWKISFTPDKFLRWTVNTLNGIVDLDSPLPFSIDSFYMITATYDGALVALYLNAELIAYKILTGPIRTTTLPFLMGQMLPDDANYNFKGIIDEVKLFDQALAPAAVAMLYQQSTTALRGAHTSTISKLLISPNPAISYVRVTLSPESNTGTDIYITSVHGSQLLYKHIESRILNFNVDTSAFPAGVYIITTLENKHIAVGRFIKL